MKRSFKLCAVAAATMLGLTVASSASANEHPGVFLAHYTDHQEESLGNDGCVSFPVKFTYDSWGTFRLVPHGPSWIPYGASNFNEVGVFTNLDNGKTFSFVTHGVDKDVHITDDGAGILTINALEAGPVNYYGPDGKPLYREAGLFTFTVVIDTKGTPDFEDDVTLSKTGTGYFGIDQAADRDFCATLAQYLG